MQMLPHPWGIAVSGSATVTAEPDVARVRFRVTRAEQTPAAAFDATRAAVRTVRDTLRSHGVADAAVEASRLDLTTLTDYADGRSRVVGYQCQAAFAVTSGALDDVEALLVDVVAAGANEIESVTFDVSARAALQADARRAAVADARAKAGLYADAAGVRVGAVLHLEDADAAPPGVTYARAKAADLSQDLVSGAIVISANVVVGYALTAA